MTKPSPKPAIKIMAIIGALILLLGAVFHLSAMGRLIEAVSGVTLDFRRAIYGVWAIPSVHWIYIACLSIGLSRYKSKACAIVLMAFGVMLLSDAFITFLHVGAVIGVYIMAAAGACLLASGVMLRAQMKAE